MLGDIAVPFSNVKIWGVQLPEFLSPHEITHFKVVETEKHGAIVQLQRRGIFLTLSHQSSKHAMSTVVHLSLIEKYMSIYKNQSAIQ